MPLPLPIQLPSSVGIGGQAETRAVVSFRKLSQTVLKPPDATAAPCQLPILFTSWRVSRGRIFRIRGAFGVSVGGVFLFVGRHHWEQGGLGGGVFRRIYEITWGLVGGVFW
jgi:hypothetical protein